VRAEADRKRSETQKGVPKGTSRVISPHTSVAHPTRKAVAKELGISENKVKEGTAVATHAPDLAPAVRTSEWK